MPLTFLIWDVLGSSKTDDRIGAASTFLGVEVTEAIHTVSKFIAWGESLSSQWLLASSTKKTFLVPGLIMVGDPSCGNRLLALNTLHGKLLFITRYTIVLVILGNEALCAHWLLAAVTDETSLMPAVTLMFHLTSTWNYRLLTFLTLGGIFICITFCTEQLLILGGERLIHQWPLALEAIETGFMPVTVFIGQVLIVASNWFLAFLAGIWIKTFIALHTIGILLLKDVFFPKERLLAVVAVEMFCHCASWKALSTVPMVRHELKW